MSFLNPATPSPRLGIDLSALLRLRTLEPGAIEPNAAWAVQTAEAAGADTLILSLSAAELLHQREDIDAVKSAMIASQFDTALSAEMIDLVGMLRPASVCFRTSAFDLENENRQSYSDNLLALMRRAVAQLEALSIRVIASIDVNSTPLHLLRDAGVTSVEFDARCYTLAKPADKTAALQALTTVVLGAKQLGMSVHLRHCIGYCHVEQLARLGDVEQINIGYAIVARSLVVGWQAAINEMKALLVTCHAPARNRLDAGTIQ